MESNNSYGSLLKHPGFLNLWINQIIVQFSYNSLNFALILWVFHITGSNTAVASLLVAVYLPSLLFGMFSGVLVDMIDRKKIIIILDFLMAVLVLSLIFFKASYILTLVITFLINTIAQLYFSAESSSLPIIIKKEQLFAANSLFSTTFFSMFLLGFGFSGPMISLFGIDFIFMLGATALFIAFLLANRFPSLTTKENIATLNLKKAIKTKKAELAFEIASNEVKKTITMIKGKLPISSALIILASMQAIIGALAAILPSFLERILQIRTTDASYIIIIPLGIGMVFGAFLIGKIGYKIPRRILVGKAVLIAGLMLFLLGFSPIISPAIQHFPKPRAVSFLLQPSLSTTVAIGSLLLGMIVVSIVIPSQTVLQENTPDEDRGKVFGVLMALISGLSLPPILFVGILSDIFGTLPIFIGLGGFIAIFGLLILKPDFFFEKTHLPFKVREFLGLGHWEK